MIAAHVAAAEAHRAVVGVEEAGQQIDQRRLARAGAADDGELPALGQLDVDMLQRELPRSAVDRRSGRIAKGTSSRSIAAALGSLRPHCGRPAPRSGRRFQARRRRLQVSMAARPRCTIEISSRAIVARRACWIGDEGDEVADCQTAAITCDRRTKHHQRAETGRRIDETSGRGRRRADALLGEGVGAIELVLLE